MGYDFVSNACHLIYFSAIFFNNYPSLFFFILSTTELWGASEEVPTEFFFV